MVVVVVDGTATAVYDDEANKKPHLCFVIIESINFFFLMFLLETN